MTQHCAAVVHLGVGLLALCGEGLLILLDVCRVHDGLTHGPGNLALVLLGDLVALSILSALGAARVTSISRLSTSLSLAVSVSMGDNLGVVTGNSGAVADLLGDNVLALLDMHLMSSTS